MSPPISIDEQLRCVTRELAFRRLAYPKWIAAGRMSEAAAAIELERMQAVFDTLERVQEILEGRIPALYFEKENAQCRKTA